MILFVPFIVHALFCKDRMDVLTGQKKSWLTEHFYTSIGLIFSQPTSNRDGLNVTISFPYSNFLRQLNSTPSIYKSKTKTKKKRNLCECARGMHACDGEDDVLTHSDKCRVLASWIMCRLKRQITSSRQHVNYCTTPTVLLYTLQLDWQSTNWFDRSTIENQYSY